MPEKRQKTCNIQSLRKKIRHGTEFDDLPDEIILLICHYLTPAEVLKVFSHDDHRLFRCIQQYRENIDLTNSSYNDFQFFLTKLVNTALQPATLTLSNNRTPTQIQTFLSKCNLSSTFHPRTVHHLSLLEYIEDDVYRLFSFLKQFESLQSLNMVQSIPDGNSSSMFCTISELFRKSIFNSFTTLTELELISNNGVILDKQLHPNQYLTRLSISLQSIDDLYVLLDGLVPNLHVLEVVLCQSRACKRSLLPQSWPSQSMSHLRKFRLSTEKNVPFTFEQLYSIVIPLNQLETLVLVIEQWHSDNDQFMENHQLDMLMEKIPLRLRYFNCSIQTTANNINMQTLATMNKRWPMTYLSKGNTTSKHLYTLPYSFEELHISMLDGDDTRICPLIETLVIDTVCSNLSHRFPNIDTLEIKSDYDLSRDDYISFRQLRVLRVNNINQVPSSVIRRLHTLTLSVIDDFVNHPIIYSNVKHLIVKKNQIGSSILLTALVQHFPHVDKLEIELGMNDDYYDNLNILLDETHLPHLTLLKTNWIDQYVFCSNIDLWLKSKTRLKWRSTPFYAGNCRNCLIICL